MLQNVLPTERLHGRAGATLAVASAGTRVRVFWESYAVGLAALLQSVWGLGSTMLWSKDETTYAQIAREIGTSGDWLTLHFNGAEWFCHPPLYFWLVAICNRFITNAELAARLPAAIFGAGCVMATAWLGRSLVSRRCGWMAAMVMLLNMQFYAESRLAILDTLFLFFLILTALGAWNGVRGVRGGWWMMFASGGLACLSKGPYGLIFMVLLTVPFLLVTRRLREVPWLWGGLLSLGLGGAWYLAEVARNGAPFVSKVFLYYFLGRVTTEVERQGGPIYFYVPCLLMGLFPWSLFLVQSLRMLWRKWRDDRAEPALFLLLWIAVLFVGLSLASTKLPTYDLLIFPAIAIAVAWYLEERVAASLRLPLVVALVLPSLSVLGLRFWGEPRFPRYFDGERGAELACLFLCAGFGWALLSCLRRPAGRAPVLPMTAAMAGYLFALTTLVSPAVEAYRPALSMATVVKARVPAQSLLAADTHGLSGLVFYSGRKVQPMRTVEDAIQFLQASDRCYLLLGRKWWRILQRTPHPPMYVLAKREELTLVSNRPE